MEYIQCEHCEKKYTVSGKLRAAAGKKIRCKYCRKIFEIMIHDHHKPVDEQEIAISNSTNDMSAQQATAELAGNGEAIENVQAHKEEQTEKEIIPAKKKINLQLLVSMVLGFSLICASVGAYLFFYKPELFSTVEEKISSPIIPQQLVHPMGIKLSNQTRIMAAEKTKQATSPSGSSKKRLQESTRMNNVETQKQPDNQTRPAFKKVTSILDGPDHPSQVCKDVAADYWLRTRLLVTTRLAMDAYMNLLNMNMEQVEEIRKLCKDKSLLGRITEAAKSDQKPTWISTEIKSRMLSDQPQN